jgi:hypothetical protein
VTSLPFNARLLQSSVWIKSVGRRRQSRASSKSLLRSSATCRRTMTRWGSEDAPTNLHRLRSGSDSLPNKHLLCRQPSPRHRTAQGPSHASRCSKPKRTARTCRLRIRSTPRCPNRPLLVGITSLRAGCARHAEICMHQTSQREPAPAPALTMLRACALLLRTFLYPRRTDPPPRPRTEAEWLAAPPDQAGW